MNIVAPAIKTEITPSDSFHVGDRVVRVHGRVPCPHCHRGRLHASAMREVGETGYAWTCTRCHRDVITITHD